MFHKISRDNRWINTIKTSFRPHLNVFARSSLAMFRLNGAGESLYSLQMAFAIARSSSFILKLLFMNQIFTTMLEMFPLTGLKLLLTLYPGWEILIRLVGGFTVKSLLQSTLLTALEKALLVNKILSRKTATTENLIHVYCSPKTKIDWLALFSPGWRETINKTQTHGFLLPFAFARRKKKYFFSQFTLNLSRGIYK